MNPNDTAAPDTANANLAATDAATQATTNATLEATQAEPDAAQLAESPVQAEPVAAFEPVTTAPIAALPQGDGNARLPRPEELLAGVRAEMDALSEAVLDAADLASRSAQAAAGVGGELKSAAGQLRQISDRTQKQNRILILAASVVMLLALVLFLAMGVRMVSRINQLDVMLLAVGKRVVELNAGLESLDSLNRSMGELAQKQDAMAKSSGDLQARIDASIKQAETLVQAVPAATAKQVAASGDNLVKQVQGINSRLQAQAGAVQGLGNELKALKGSVANVDKLNRDVQALITLQRERYLEALQKNNAAAVKERNVQFPRVSPAASRAAPADGTAAASDVPRTAN